MDTPTHDASPSMSTDTASQPASRFAVVHRLVNWARSTDLHHGPMIIVFSLAFGGLAFSAAFPEHWLRGVLVLAGAMAVAGVLRFILPPSQMELLAVRGRLVDTGFYLAVGVFLTIICFVLPNQH